MFCEHFDLFLLKICFKMIKLIKEKTPNKNIIFYVFIKFRLDNYMMYIML